MPPQRLRYPLVLMTQTNPPPGREGGARSRCLRVLSGRRKRVIKARDDQGASNPSIDFPGNLRGSWRKRRPPEIDLTSFQTGPVRGACGARMDRGHERARPPGKKTRNDYIRNCARRSAAFVATVFSPDHTANGGRIAAVSQHHQAQDRRDGAQASKYAVGGGPCVSFFTP